MELKFVVFVFKADVRIITVYKNNYLLNFVSYIFVCRQKTRFVGGNFVVYDSSIKGSMYGCPVVNCDQPIVPLSFMAGKPEITFMPGNSRIGYTDHTCTLYILISFTLIE